MKNSDLLESGVGRDLLWTPNTLYDNHNDPVQQRQFKGDDIQWSINTIGGGRIDGGRRMGEDGGRWTNGEAWAVEDDL